MLGAVTLWLLFSYDFSAQPSATQLGFGAGGLALSVIAAGLLLSSGWAFPSVSTGQLTCYWRTENVGLILTHLQNVRPRHDSRN